MTAAEPAVQGVAQIALTVTDMPRAVAFYKDAVGLRQLPIPAQASLAFFDAGGVRVMLSLPEGAPPGGGTVIYFKTPQIRAAHAAMAGRGVAFGREPHLVAKLPGREIWLAEFRDPDGNALALMGEVPAGGA